MINDEPKKTPKFLMLFPHPEGGDWKRISGDYSPNYKKYDESSSIHIVEEGKIFKQMPDVIHHELQARGFANQP
jgi:hypothetical protein